MSKLPRQFYTDINDALNSLDFYRLYKTLCKNLNIDMLALLDLNSWPEKTSVNSLIVAENMSDGVPASLTVLNIDIENIIFCSVKSSIIPEIWSNEDTNISIDFYGDLTSKQAITFPIHTATAKHFALIGIIDKQDADTFDLMSAAYHSSLIFQKYNNTILVPSALPTVTPRELEILNWSSEGKTSQEIAVILGLSEHTVNTYTARIQQKLNVVNRAQMIATAMRIGIIQ